MQNGTTTPSPSSLLRSWYPHLSPHGPILINAPMGGFAGPRLATAVTLAGGLGFIGSVNEMDKLSAQLSSAAESLSRDSDSCLPIGVGFLPFISPLPQATQVIRQHRPSAIWLFAARDLADYAVWTSAMRAASPRSKIWIQVGSVAAAVAVASSAHPPDVLVIQGLDAGGHGLARGAGIISLLPEVADALSAIGKPASDIPLIAAGGIADGRGAASALALGAAGVVMGTAFLGSSEIDLPDARYQAAVLRTRDGGQRTVRATVFDELRGPNVWPALYDGRSVVTESFTDWEGGVGIEEIRRLVREAEGSESKGFGEGDGEGRVAIWAGTGVGLVNQRRSAREIVETIRQEATTIIEGLKSRL